MLEQLIASLAIQTNIINSLQAQNTKLTKRVNSLKATVKENKKVIASLTSE